MKKICLIVTCIPPFLAVLLLIGQIVLTNELATTGNQIQALDEQIDELTLDSMNLKQQIASASSLSTIREKSTSLGFIQAKKFTVIPSGYTAVAMETAR